MMKRAATVLTALLMGCVTTGGTEVQVRNGRINPEHGGYQTYRQYCASCHGIYADGRGPLAPVLKERPADLTRLAQRYGTPLPKPMLTEFIDGRRYVRAHGPGDMPVWGDRLLLGMPESAGKSVGQRGRILVILDYLESIQVTE